MKTRDRGKFDPETGCLFSSISNDIADSQTTDSIHSLY